MIALKHCASLLLVAATLVAASAVAQDEQMRDPAADAIDFSEKPFQEGKVKLPPAPKSGDLIRFDAGPTRREFEHFVDGATLTMGDDGVIRYTLVITSDAGARNVTYEGIRCETREHKVYAYGRLDGSWVEAHKQEWRRIGAPSLEGPVYVLYNDFFCPRRQGVASAAEALAALKAGNHPKAAVETQLDW